MSASTAMCLSVTASPTVRVISVSYNDVTNSTIKPHSLRSNLLRIYRSLLAVSTGRSCAFFHGSAS